jgi:hypothetical protein
VQACVSGNIDEMGVEGTPGGRTSRHGFGGVTSHTLLRQQSIRGQAERGSYSESDKAATAEEWCVDHVCIKDEFTLTIY